MSPFPRILALFLMTLFLGGTTLSCGEESEDVVYVYAFNGYSGGGKLSIFSSAGQIAEGLEFGESSETPLALDRTRFTGELTFLISGGQAQVVNFDAFALYPNESVTIAVTRKTDVSAYEFVVLRHHVLKGRSSATEATSESPFQCVVQIYNTLSLSNNLSGGDQRYDVGTEWLFQRVQNDENLIVGDPIRRGDPGAALTNFDAYIYESGGLLSSDLYTLTGVCGEIKVADLEAGVRDSIIRSRLGQLAPIRQSPWLYLVEPIGQQNAPSWRWGVWNSAAGNFIEGIPSTAEFRNCITGAVTYRETTMVGDQDCPDPSTAELDAIAFEQCLNPVTYPIQTLQPGGVNNNLIYFNPFGNETTLCSGTFRPRTRAVDSVFDAATNTFVEVSFSNPLYQWQYLLLYGSPFNPGVHFLKADALKADLRTVENPGGIRFEGPRQAGN